MNICIPVNEDQGLASTVCAHFGSAPIFMVVDPDDESCRIISNQKQHHGHGRCAPLSSLQGQGIDALVVGGIGMRALEKLLTAQIQVYLSSHATVSETIRAYRAGTLEAMQPGMACTQHGHGGQGRNCDHS